MVFRGKPSKACERCRARRLRCDLHSGACGQCVRASVPCSGYRDVQQLRIQNESQSVMRRVLKNAPPSKPPSLPLSIDLQARDAFFSYYVTNTSRCWVFLKRYYHPMDSPDHLTLAIEAVSLAYFWHQVYSDAALATAREKYILALRMTNKTLKYPKEATKYTTLLASLLLDLFEKITDSKPRNNKSWISHVNGALALVRLRGLDQFQDPSEFPVLVRLSNHYMISCVASGSPVPDELIAVRNYVGKILNVQDYTLQISDVMVQYANLRSGIRRGILSNDEYIRVSLELEIKLQVLDLDMPPSWRYSTTILDHKSDRAFDLYFDSYPHRNICQAWNFLRLVRILLNESLIEQYSASPIDDKHLALITAAHDNIKVLAGEICACVPQYVDCDGAARQRLSASEKSEFPDQTPDQAPDRGPVGAGHLHTPYHRADCYTLILPLYAAGRSKVVPDVKPWAIKQLHYIGSHFYIRNAEIVAQMLEREIDACPWEVFAMLGSYAFNA
ncbi:MAG: hypothetical protein M1834_001227 [Cirrosporium novae-zelandiae]|nr:MAG: hypothetical protein M1834_001227 [Cirrosporium novae-zelandiae]